MKKLKSYKQFLAENFEHKLDEKQVEKEVYKEYSENFWKMALKSRLFEDYEKKFISEDLVDTKIDLMSLNESFVNENMIGRFINSVVKTVGQGIDWVKDKGKKAWNWFVDKLKKLRDGISWIVSGMKTFIIKIWNSLVYKIINISKKISSKLGLDKKRKEADEQLAKSLKENPEQVAIEAKNLSTLIQWTYNAKSEDLSKDNAMTNVINNKTDEVKEAGNKMVDEVIAEVESQSQSDKELPSLDLDNQKNEDMLYNLYNFGMLCEGSAAAGENKSAWMQLVDWLGTLFGAGDFPEADKDGKKPGVGKKLLWLVNLIARIGAAFLNPVLFAIKKLIQTVGGKALDTFSWFVSSLSGGKLNKDMVKQVPGQMAKDLKARANDFGTFLGRLAKEAGDALPEGIPNRGLKVKNKEDVGQPTKESLRHAEYSKVNEGAVSAYGEWMGVSYAKFPVFGAVLAYGFGTTIDLAVAGYYSKHIWGTDTDSVVGKFFANNELFKTVKYSVAEFLKYVLKGIFTALGVEDVKETILLLLTSFCTIFVVYDLIVKVGKLLKVMKIWGKDWVKQVAELNKNDTNLPETAKSSVSALKKFQQMK
jgi:hypothetical protein